MPFFEPVVGLRSTVTFRAVDGGAELGGHQTDVPAEFISPEVARAFQFTFGKFRALLDRDAG